MTGPDSLVRCGMTRLWHTYCTVMDGPHLPVLLGTRPVQPTCPGWYDIPLPLANLGKACKPDLFWRV